MRPRQVAALTLCLLASLGCDSTSSPSDPGAAPLAVFEGEMVADDVLFEPVTFAAGDTIRLEVDEFVVIEGAEAPFDLILGVGIGFLNAAGDGCSNTSSRFLTVGGQWVVHLSSSNYCVSVFDVGTIPDESKTSYRVLAFNGV